jgi:hypothetical protein
MLADVDDIGQRALRLIAVTDPLTGQKPDRGEPDGRELCVPIDELSTFEDQSRRMICQSRGASRRSTAWTRSAARRARREGREGTELCTDVRGVIHRPRYGRLRDGSSECPPSSFDPPFRIKGARWYAPGRAGCFAGRHDPPGMDPAPVRGSVMKAIGTLSKASGVRFLRKRKAGRQLAAQVPAPLNPRFRPKP